MRSVEELRSSKTLSSHVSSLMTFDKRDFSNPSASSIMDETFSCFGIGEVTDLDNLNDGENRSSGLITPRILVSRL